MENKLKFYREQKTGLTQEKLAKKCSIAIRTYQYYETGDRNPDIYTAQKLAKVLDVDVNKLFPLNNSRKGE